MSHHDYEKDKREARVEGNITDIFAHRFVITDAQGKKTLADLGKHSQEQARLELGATVVAQGEMKPSELKVETLSINGQPVSLTRKEDHKKDRSNHKNDPSAQPRDLGKIIRAAEDRGLTVIGQKIRPEHTEILGMTQHNELTELHIDFNGTVRQSRLVEPDDQKWAAELAAA